MSNGVTSVPATQKAVTILSVGADMTVSEEKVAIDAVFGKDFFLQLSKEAFIGSPMSVAYWLRETYAVTGDGIDWLTLEKKGYEDSEAFAQKYRKFKLDTMKNNRKAKDTELYKDIKEHLQKRGLPEQALVIMTTAMLAEVSITDLLIQIKDKGENNPKEKNIMFGVAIYFRSPLPLLPNINVDKLTFLLKHSSTGNFENFPKRSEALGPPASVNDEKAKGSINFIRLPTADDQIRLGGTEWSFGTASTGTTTKIGTDIRETVNNLAGDLKGSKEEGISQCTYTGQGEILNIEFNEGGSVGNDFTLSVPKSLGVISATTLRGGGGARQIPVGKKAQGSIKFTAIPTAANKINLGGTVWNFGTKSDPAEKTTKIGTDLPATIKTLAIDLKGSEDANIGKCTYTAKADTLEIEFNEPGTAGDVFTYKGIDGVDKKLTGGE